MQTAPIAPVYSFWTMFLSGVALNLWSAVPWTVLFLFIRWTGLRLYVLNDREVCRRVQRRVTNTSHMSDDNKSYGYAIGRWYLMDISVENNDGDITYSIWMIATVASHKRLTADLREATEGGDGMMRRGPNRQRRWLSLNGMVPTTISGIVNARSAEALSHGKNRPLFSPLSQSWWRRGSAVTPLSFSTARLAPANP